MSGVTSQPSSHAATGSYTVTVELKGHLIDSLTLSKVIDRIQAMGGDYRLNDIQIGSLKKDISAVNMTLMAPDEKMLAELTETIQPYGAVVTSEMNAQVASCAANGQLPKEAFTLKAPNRVRYQDRWVSLDTDALALVVDSTSGNIRLEKASAVKQGDLVVCGTQGLQW